MVTLGIDYGSSNIGVALVRNTGDSNEPLFAGTFLIDARKLRDKVETRAGIRRLRRTRKTKKRRLRNLSEQLHGLHLDDDTINRILRFCERRGYKFLFDKGILDSEKEDEAELTYRFTRQEFFKSLEVELASLIQDSTLRTTALSICERILNRHGDPFKEIRLIRIDNRGVSRCAWEGCARVTPRRDNALRDAITQQLCTVLQESLKGDDSGLSRVMKAAEELEVLGKRIRSASGESAKEEKKALRKKARVILRSLRDEFYMGDFLDSDKAWKYIETGAMNIIETNQGRNRYCREHSKTYIDTILAGKPAPFKKTILESDIISRREQIVYQKLWRYIEARLLPLVPEGIDRIVVERNAFDLMAGSRKNIQKASDKYIEELYQQGPMHGFKNRVEMLREEFGGLCAYCGCMPGTLRDADHILPQADFFFDSYLNVLPACPKCNSDRKGRMSITQLSLAIQPEAYAAYDQYLKKKFGSKPLHFLHTIKKGILNLMQDSSRLWEAERYLSIIAQQFARIVQTQRSPRPLSRYLTTKLEKRQESMPEIRFRNGRHTALYRNVAYPEFEKAAEKAEGGLVNHALDALLLASDLPDPYPIDAKNVSMTVIRSWAETVQRKAAKPGTAGIPEPPNNGFSVKGFEAVDPQGYILVDLAAMRWNQQDSMTHKQDPYGWSEKHKLPTKRTSAVSLYAELMKEKDSKKLAGVVQRVHHPALRKVMEEGLEAKNPGVSTADALRRWLRESVKKSINMSSFSNHLGDQARKADLMAFAEKEDAPIPAVIGVKMFDIGVRGKIDLRRTDRQTGGIGHRYMTQPTNRAVLLAYPAKTSGEADLRKPYIASVRQNLAIVPEEAAAFKDVPERLKDGITLGMKGNSGVGWKGLVEKYLRDCGFHSYVMLTPGCVLCYNDGRTFFIRNFKPGKNFSKGMLRDVIGIRRTPFVDRMLSLKTLT